MTGGRVWRRRRRHHCAIDEESKENHSKEAVKMTEASEATEPKWDEGEKFGREDVILDIGFFNEALLH